MRVDHQGNCEYRFSSILIAFIDFHCYYRFFLLRVNLSERRISFVRDRRKGIQMKLLFVGAPFL